MSLINDALKRAGSAPPPVPSADPESAPPPMQPVVERKSHPVWPVVLLPLGLLLLFALAGVLLWKGYQAKRTAASGAPDNPVAAREHNRALTSPPKPTRTLLRPQEKAALAAPAPVETSAPPPTAVKPTDPRPAQTVAGTGAPPSTSAAPPAQVKPAVTTSVNGSFPAMKLQGIFYRPSNPSVMINNKTLFVGETIGDAKVVAIDRTSVTVECNGQTRVLTLP